jgi:hypothetical protein
MFKFLYPYLLLIALSTALLSCSKGNDSTPSPKQLLIGVWKPKTYKYAFTVADSSQSDSGTYSSNLTVEFKDNGTLTSKDSSGAASQNGTWSLTADGKKITITGVDELDNPASATWVVSLLTSSQLILSINETGKKQGITYKIEAEQTFGK